MNISPLSKPLLSEKTLEQILESLREYVTSRNVQPRKSWIEAQSLRDELRARCQGDPKYRASLKKGLELFRQIREVRLEMLAERRKEVARNVEMKKRIIAACDAASGVEDPAQFSEQMKQCRELWKSLGPTGMESKSLWEAFQEARLKFQMAVKQKRKSSPLEGKVIPFSHEIK